MSKPRPYTVDEMRTMILDHIRGMVNYWSETDLSRTEFRNDIARSGRSETHYRLEGLAFSILVMLDGGSGLPAMDLIPSSHPDDEQYHKDNDENWWPSDTVINECQLHEIWSTRKS